MLIWYCFSKLIQSWHNFLVLSWLVLLISNWVHERLKGEDHKQNWWLDKDQTWKVGSFFKRWISDFKASSLFWSRSIIDACLLGGLMSWKREMNDAMLKMTSFVFDICQKKKRNYAKKEWRKILILHVFDEYNNA